MIEDKTYITPKSSMPEIVITPSGQSPEELAIELAYLDRFKNARLSIPVDNTVALQSKMNKAVAERNGLGRLFAPYFLGVFNPLAFTASMIGGYTVDEVSSAAYNATHDDKAAGFGQALVRSIAGKGHPVAETVAGFFNPGYLLGGSTLRGETRQVPAHTPKSYKRNPGLEFGIKMWDNSRDRKFDATDVESFSNSKSKTRYLDETYDGRYTASTQESFDRRNATGSKRMQFMLKHPVKSVVGPNMSKNTTFEEELNAAARRFANKYKQDFPNALRNNIEYDASLGKGILGYSEGVAIGPRLLKGIKVVYNKKDTSPNALLTVNHELAGHSSGNFNDGYIYNYLKENDIIDWDKVGDYFKDADRGEIGLHLAELADYLGFRIDNFGKYSNPFGKTKINKHDVQNYTNFLKNNGFAVSKTIFGNIKNMNKFVKFLNEHPFVNTSITLGGATTINSNDKNVN